MKCIIVVNKYIDNKSQLYQANRFLEELLNKGIDAKIIKNGDEACILDNKINSFDCDFVIYLDKDKVLSQMLELNGNKLFNSSKSIEICDNKMLTHIYLATFGIKMPNVVYAPLCYNENANISMDLVKKIEKLNFPLVAKMCYGSLGKGVFLIRTKNELLEFENKYKTCEHFYEEYIDCKTYGQDTRVIVIGKKVIAGITRTNKNDFRSNIGLGGEGSKVILSEKIINLCENVAELLNLDYCGIDVLEDKNGNFYICEVNSNAFISEIERITNINIAKIYVEYILNSLER